MWQVRGELPDTLLEIGEIKRMRCSGQKKDESGRQKLSQKHRNDIILAVVMIFVAAAGFLWYNLTKEAGSYIVVLQNGNEVQRFSLEEDREYRIEKERGAYNLLSIKNGKAYMKSADCPDQICVNHRPISNVGETIVCLPNELVIKVVAGEEAAPEIDLII